MNSFQNFLKLQNPTLLMVLFSSLLVFFRMIYFHNLAGLFILWNLFLAIVPYLIIRLEYFNTSLVYKWFLIALSFLFLPNSIYIFTDIIHLRKHLGAPIWYDSLILYSCSFSGMLFFSKTLLKLKTEFGRYIQMKPLLEVIILVCVLLSSFGVYLGRYVRLNSWDVFTKPVFSCHKILQSIHSESIGITLLFAVFIYIMHSAFTRHLDEEKINTQSY